MSMDGSMDGLKKFAGQAGTFFTRAKQFTEEKLGSAEKTELDAHFENLQLRADRTKTWTERILKNTEAVLQPNPNLRLEDSVNMKLERKVRERDTNHEFLGHSMVDAGNELGPGTQYGAALVQCGQTQLKLGQIGREYMQSSVNNFINPLGNFLEGDMKTIMKERKLLENKRLDLDACKNKLRKAKSLEGQKTAESELRIAQSEFDRQYEITKLLLEGITSAHSTHLSRLQDYIEAQQVYYAQCQQTLGELQRSMGKDVGSLQGDYGEPGAPATAENPSLPGTLGSIRPPNASNPSAPPDTTDFPEDPSRPSSGIRKAKVLYDYEASDTSELSLLADEIINVYSLPGMDSDWMMAERAGQRGKVPTTYLDLIQ